MCVANSDSNQSFTVANQSLLVFLYLYYFCCTCIWVFIQIVQVMKKWKFIQLVLVVTVVILFIEYNTVNTDTDYFKTNLLRRDVSKSLSSERNVTTKLLHFNESIKGFVIASSFWEQQVGAALNLWILSKWAATIGVYPVEPFVVNSNFVLPNNLSHSTSSNLLQFRDYFDLEFWNGLCSGLKLMPLISWEVFLHTKSKHLIVAVISLETDHESDARCKNRLQNFINSISILSQEISFTIVKRVCFVFSGKRSIAVDDFNKKLYGNFDPKQVTVWFSVWPGVNNFRIHFKETQYWRNSQSMYSIHPSKRIITDSQKYVHNFMNSEFGQYVAVSFRSVKRAKRFQLEGISHELRSKFFRMCIKELAEKLKGLGSNHKIFLSIDLGEFGDNSATKYLSSNVINDILNSTIEVVYNSKLSLQDYERSFLLITNGIKDRGYVAAVQRTIVEKSKCLILFGGNSNFQRSILINYIKNHMTPCVVEVCYIT